MQNDQPNRHTAALPEQWLEQMNTANESGAVLADILRDWDREVDLAELQDELDAVANRDDLSPQLLGAAREQIRIAALKLR